MGTQGPATEQLPLDPWHLGLQTTITVSLEMGSRQAQGWISSTPAGIRPGLGGWSAHQRGLWEAVVQHGSRTGTVGKVSVTFGIQYYSVLIYCQCNTKVEYYIVWGYTMAQGQTQWGRCHWHLEYNINLYWYILFSHLIGSKSYGMTLWGRCHWHWNTLLTSTDILYYQCGILYCAYQYVE